MVNMSLDDVSIDETRTMDGGRAKFPILLFSHGADRLAEIKDVLRFGVDKRCHVPNGSQIS